MVERSQENSSLLLFGTNQSLSCVDQEPVNMPTSNNVVLISIIIPMLLSILLVNIKSIIMIKKRESTLVNNLLTMDCTANALITVISSIQQYKVVGLELYCAPVTVLYSRCFVEQTFITWLICFRRDPW